MASNDLDILEWILGNLGIHTTDNLLQLTDGDFEDTLKLISSMRPVKIADTSL